MIVVPLNQQHADRLDDPGRLGDTDYVLSVKGNMEVQFPLWWRVAIDHDGYTEVVWWSHQYRGAKASIENGASLEPGWVISRYRVGDATDMKRYAMVLVKYDPVPQATDMHEPPAYAGELDWHHDGSELVHPFID